MNQRRKQWKTNQGKKKLTLISTHNLSYGILLVPILLIPYFFWEWYNTILLKSQWHLRLPIKHAFHLGDLWLFCLPFGWLWSLAKGTTSALAFLMIIFAITLFFNLPSHLAFHEIPRKITQKLLDGDIVLPLQKFCKTRKNKVQKTRTCLLVVRWSLSGVRSWFWQRSTVGSWAWKRSTTGLWFQEGSTIGSWFCKRSTVGLWFQQGSTFGSWFCKRPTVGSYFLKRSTARSSPI